MGFLGRGQQPLPPARDSGGAVRSPAGFGPEQRPPKGFPLFSIIRMASHCTIILLGVWTELLVPPILLVDYRAAIGGKTPCPPLPLATPLQRRFDLLTATFQVLFIVSLFYAWNITTVEINSGVHLLKSQICEVPLFTSGGLGLGLVILVL